MTKKLRKRKIKALMKLAAPEDILMNPPVTPPEEPEYTIKIYDSFDNQHSLSYQGIVDESDIPHADYLIEGTKYHHYIGRVGPFENLNFYTEYYDLSEEYKEKIKMHKETIEDFNKSEMSSKKDIDKINNLTFDDIIIKTRNVEGSYSESYIKIELDSDLFISFNDYSNRTENKLNEINYDFEEVKLIIDKIANKEEVSSSDKNLIVDLVKDYYFKHSIVRPYEGRITKRRLEKYDDLKKEKSKKEDFIQNPRFSYVVGSKLIKKSMSSFFKFWTKIINKENQKVNEKCYNLFEKSLNEFKNLENIIYTKKLNPAKKAAGVYLTSRNLRYLNGNTIVNNVFDYHTTTHELLHHWDHCFKEYNSSCSGFTETETLSLDEIADKHFDNKEYFKEFINIYNKISTKHSLLEEDDGDVRDKKFKEYLDKTYFDDEKKETLMNYYRVYDDLYFAGSHKIYNFDIRTFNEAKKFYSDNFHEISAVLFHDFEVAHFHETYRFLKELIYRHSSGGMNYENIFNALMVKGPFKKEYYNEDLRSFCALTKPTSENIEKLIGFRRIVKVDGEENMSSKAFALNKNLRKRKIKALMKTALMPEVINQNPDVILNPLEERNLVPKAKVVPMCDWNDSILLDLTGIVPIAGDAIDLGRSFVYINCGKYLDAAVGILCAVPVYGSAIGLSLKGLLKSGAIKTVRDAVFSAIDIAKKYYNESEISVIVRRLKQALPVIFSNMKQFLNGLIKNEFVLLEDAGKIRQSLSDFESLLNRSLNFDESVYKKWKNKSLSNSNFNLQKNIAKNTDSVKNLFSNFLEILKIPISTITAGKDFVFQRIKNGTYSAYISYIEKRKKEFSEKIKNIKSKDEVIDFLNNDSDLDDYYDEAYEEIILENNTLEDMKDILSEYQNIQLDFNDEANQRFLLGFSRDLSETISLNFDIFYMHVTSKNYINMLKRNLSALSPKDLDNVDLKKLIEEYFQDPSFSSVKINVAKEGSLPGDAAGIQYHGSNLIEIVERNLEDYGTTVSHELLHHFDENFLRFFSNKKGLGLNIDTASFLANATHPRLVNVGNIKELKTLLSDELKMSNYNLVSNSNHLNSWDEAEDYFIEYLTRPTEVLSYFNDIRSLMVLEGFSNKYPSPEEVLKFARSAKGQKRVHFAFLSLINAIDEFQYEYGQKAYKMLSIPSEYSEEIITGDLALDFFKQYGV